MNKFPLLFFFSLLSSAVQAQETDLKDLPITEVVSKQPTRTFAVFLSGDGGWASIDKAIAGALQKHGVSVVGLSSLKYFWRARTPEGGATDLERIIKHYRIAWNADSVIVIGYSRGASVLPFFVNRLPADERARVQLMALVGAERAASFKFHPLDIFSSSSGKDDPPSLPEIQRLQGVTVICFYGEKETDTLCPDLQPPHIAIKLGGGHHFDGNYAAIGERIWEQVSGKVPR